jgi:hypothetical protein
MGDKKMEATHTPTNEQAIKAIKAAKGFKTWGRYAAMRYCKKNNLPLSLVTLARVLENAKGL